MAQVEEEVQEVTTVETATPKQVVTTKKVVSPPVVEEHPKKVYQEKKIIFRAYQFIWYILGVVEVLLGFRVLLKMLGANPFSGFTAMIYGLSDPLAQPFLGILQAMVVGNSVFELSTFIAMIVYAIVAYGIVQLVQFIKPVSPEEVEQTVDTQ